MKAVYQKDRPELCFEHMDATQMTFPNETFTVVLDKGTLDALMPNNNAETIANVDKYFNVNQKLMKND